MKSATSGVKQSNNFAQNNDVSFDETNGSILGDRSGSVIDRRSNSTLGQQTEMARLNAGHSVTQTATGAAGQVNSN